MKKKEQDRRHSECTESRLTVRETQKHIDSLPRLQIEPLRIPDHARPGSQVDFASGCSVDGAAEDLVQHFVSVSGVM